MNLLPREIFKAYDIRGIVGKTLTPADRARRSARRSASLARERGRDTFAIGRDGRLSGPELAGALADGMRASGANVIDVGMVATPMTYFAAQHLGTRLQRDGDRQPQSARLQRAQDGRRRRHAVGRRHPGRCARASSDGRLATGAGAYSHARHRARLPRSHRRRRQARAPDEDRRRLRQRRRRRVRADAVPAAGLRRRRALLRRRRPLSRTTIPIRRSRRTCAT